MKRGRKNPADLNVVSIGIVPELRPEPPADLNELEQAEWRNIVDRMPADWFPQETWPILRQLCVHIRLAAMLQGELRLFPPGLFEDGVRFGQFDSVCRAHERESRAIATLSTKLRLTPHSRHDRQKAGVATRVVAGPKPWEI